MGLTLTGIVVPTGAGARFRPDERPETLLRLTTESMVVSHPVEVGEIDLAGSEGRHVQFECEEAGDDWAYGVREVEALPEE